MTRYRVGCTGWGYEDWRGGFYPSGAPASEFLARYARVFDTTEVDSSYYAAPTRAQTERWAEATPDGFLFGLKFPGEVTHKRRLRDVEGHVDDFLAALTPLRTRGKLGPLVLQLPASVTRGKDGAALEAFLQRFPRSERLCVELRDASWWVPDTYRMLADAGASLVWSATEAGRTPAVLTSDLAYVRIIGDRTLTTFDRVQRDATGELQHWRDRLRDEGQSARDAMVLVNNRLMGFAPESVRLMHAMLGLPEPDLGAALRDGGQQRLRF